ncbi:hypothetical protein FACS189411_10010 [Bacteroidia bacterium]|nr:hypothetical protein FACS189411_10010 [Bacteroidia bacterium]
MGFIEEHAGDDLERLLLSASKYPGMDVPFAVEQIAARRQIRDKLPSWYNNPGLVFPSKIAAEQCSSELTARYKQRLISATDHVCDLTGGLGIDSFFLSQKAQQVTYIERFPSYCKAARHNFASLGANNIEVVEGDARQLLSKMRNGTLFYVDPARRGEGNKRVFALKDCEPDLIELLPLLWKYAPKVIAKISPMADISQTLALLPCTTAIHVLSVKNDCKELLFVLERDAAIVSPPVHCIHFTAEGEESFTFNLQEEKETVALPAPQVEAYLYEPNASILKAGAFKSITRLGVSKLNVNSHCYTSNNLLINFPGRRFIVDEVLPFSSKLCKTIHKTILQANITTRNFPLSVKELRQRTKIAEGGDIYLFATTLANNEKVLIKVLKT